MNLFQSVSILCFVLCSSFVLGSCNIADRTKYKDDPYGLLEAEELGGQPKRLIKCSHNEECPEYAQALFWVAADILSEASAETIEVEGKNFALTDDMTIDEMAEKLGPQLEGLMKTGPPEYDFGDPEFNRGLNIMHKAHEAGSIYASNELGLLFMEHAEMQSLVLAKEYFVKALNGGDLVSAYNLARIERMQHPANYKTILGFLKKATESNQEDLGIMYLLGLETFGSEEERQNAINFLKKEKLESSFLRDEFEAHFNIK